MTRAARPSARSRRAAVAARPPHSTPRPGRRVSGVSMPITRTVSSSPPLVAIRTVSPSITSTILVVGAPSGGVSSHAEPTSATRSSSVGSRYAALLACVGRARNGPSPGRADRSSPAPRTELDPEGELTSETAAPVADSPFGTSGQSRPHQQKPRPKTTIVTSRQSTALPARRPRGRRWSAPVVPSPVVRREDWSAAFCAAHPGGSFGARVFKLPFQRSRRRP